MDHLANAHNVKSGDRRIVYKRYYWWHTIGICTRGPFQLLPVQEYAVVEDGEIFWIEECWGDMPQRPPMPIPGKPGSGVLSEEE